MANRHFFFPLWETHQRGCFATILTHKEENKISKQPVIFNITYTPWKIKSNASERERKAFSERPYYDMSDSGNNIYKYMTADRKLNGENSKTETSKMIRYFEKSTGVFNGDGVISEEELKAIQQRAKANKHIWHGFVSLDEEHSYRIDTPQKCMRLIKRNFNEFFREMGLDPKNIDLICSLHKDKAHHLHIHFWFAEKEPKCKYRKKQTEYRHKGKIEKDLINKMRTRLDLYVTKEPETTYEKRDDAIKELKELLNRDGIFEKDDIKKAVIDLVKKLPSGVTFSYGHRDMIPFRKDIDDLVNKILLYDRKANKAHVAFHTELGKLRQQAEGYTHRHTSLFLLPSQAAAQQKPPCPQSLNLIDELEYDYNRRLGNIVLRAIKFIKPECFERTRKYKVNDKKLKRKLAISLRNVGRRIDGLLGGFLDDLTRETGECRNRLQEIEREMEEERKQREQEEVQTETKRKKNYNEGK